MPTIGQKDSYVEWSCAEHTGLFSSMTKSKAAASCQFLFLRTKTTPIRNASLQASNQSTAAPDRTTTPHGTEIRTLCADGRN